MGYGPDGAADAEVAVVDAEVAEVDAEVEVEVSDAAVPSEISGDPAASDASSPGPACATAASRSSNEAWSTAATCASA